MTAAAAACCCNRNRVTAASSAPTGPSLARPFSRRALVANRYPRPDLRRPGSTSFGLFAKSIAAAPQYSVRSGSTCDMAGWRRRVRYHPDSGPNLAEPARLRSAMCGRLPAGKGFLHGAVGRLRPCVRPVCAVHMTAGHNALRGSGPGQKLAFDDAMAHCGLS
jgi:hypothetical protein